MRWSCLLRICYCWWSWGGGYVWFLNGLCCFTKKSPTWSAVGNVYVSSPTRYLHTVDNRADTVLPGGVRGKHLMSHTCCSVIRSARSGSQFWNVCRQLILLKTLVAHFHCETVHRQRFATQCFYTCRLVIRNQTGLKLETKTFCSVTGTVHKRHILFYV